MQKCSPTNNMVQKGYNTRLKMLKRKQELTGIVFGILKCEIVTPKNSSNLVLRL